jgi:two-component system cell cycle sensor histidine kinase/response regulator CckA
VAPEWVGVNPMPCHNVFCTMTTEGIMKSLFCEETTESVGTLQTTRVSYILILATLGSYLVVGLICLYFRDWNTLGAIGGGSITLILPYVLFRRGRLRVGILLLMTIVIATVTAIATVGQGIHDLATVVYPIIFIYVGLTSDRAMLGVCGGLTFVALLWLALGQSFGWFTTVPLFPDPWNLFYLAVLSILLAITALAVDLLSSNMRSSLAKARDEIEERKRTEAALRASEAKFRAVVENSHDGILFCDPDARIHYRSPSYRRINGYADEERIGHTGFETVHPDDMEGVRSTWATILGHPESSHTTEYRIRHKSGGWRWIESSGQSLLDNPDVQAVVVASRDITGRKQAEDALRASEERFRKMFEDSPIGIVFLGKQREITLTNQSYRDFLGLTETEIIQRGPRGLLHPDDLAPSFALSDKLRAGQIPLFHMEQRYLRGDGAVVWADAHMTALRDGDGQVIQTIGWLRDITARKIAEQALSEKSVELRTAQRLANTGNWSWTIATNEVQWSDELYRICGYDVNLPPPPIPDMASFYTPESWVRLNDAVAEALRNGNPYELELDLVRTDGVIRNTFARGRVDRDAGGRIVRLHGTVQDISDRRRGDEEKARLEAGLQQAQKMESVGRLAGGVAHDFNNMLMVISGHAEIGLQLVKPTEPLHASLMEIHKAANRSAELTRQLLAFARKQTVSPRVLDLSETVHGMLKMLKRLIGEDIRLLLKVSAGLWSVNMDPSQVDQILANLCVNARDAIHDVGTITVETRNCILDDAFRAEHRGSVPGEYVLLEVADDGCGMDKETQSHLFEPFFTTKPLGQGTGLGLATIYGAVKQNNGFISFKSEKGVGTLFSIYLPRYVGTTEGVQPDGGEVREEGHGTILVVEDEPSSLGLIATMLENSGYTVLAANTTDDALTLARGKGTEIELLLTDVVMPAMNGRDLALKLRSANPRLKTLYMSGYTADVITNRGVLDKGVSFVQKPFSAKDPAAKVREVLAGGA